MFINKPSIENLEHEILLIKFCFLEGLFVYWGPDSAKNIPSRAIYLLLLLLVKEELNMILRRYVSSQNIFSEVWEILML